MGIEEGFNQFGPVSHRKGCIEYNRLVNVFESIQANGYQRSTEMDGDVGGMLLRHDSKYRFVVSQGHHRMAAVASLGRKRIPVRIICPIPVEVRDVEHWTQVKNGIWGRDSAVRYFKHLFDSNSRAWARKRNLLPPTS